jgi:DNA-binding transcriptional LysR family regulator
MDFDQLESFLEVARLSSFSRAAERRFRTQPAISSQIRLIEEEVGAKLFDRSGGRVTLTAAGKLFQQYAQDVLEARRTMLANIAETHHVPRGEIVVSANEGTCLHILPEVFAQFKREYPAVGVNVKRSERGRILEAILDNACDFGVVSMPVNDKRFAVVPIHRDELVVITAAGHHLAGHKSATLADVCEYPLLLPKIGRTRDMLNALFEERQLRPAISMELDSSELLKRFVAANVGIGFIPHSNITEELQAKVLAALTIADATIQRDLALVYRKEKALSRAALAFIDIAVKLKSAEPPKRRRL